MLRLISILGQCSVRITGRSLLIDTASIKVMSTESGIVKNELVETEPDVDLNKE